MRTWQAGMALMCCGTLLLTGCSRQDQERSRRESQAAREEIAALRKQVKVLEHNIRVLQNELVAARAGRAAETVSVAEKVPVAETGAKPSDQSAPRALTRAEFKNKVLGLRSQELMQLAGTPDAKTGDSEFERWVYNQLPCKKNDGTLEAVCAHVLVENGRVIRVLFVDDVQYGL